MLDIIQAAFNTGAQFDLAGDYETYLLTKTPLFWLRFRRPQDYVINAARKITRVNDYSGATTATYFTENGPLTLPGLQTRGAGPWPAALFNGTDTGLVTAGTANIDVTQPFTLFAVFNPTTAATQYMISHYIDSTHSALVQITSAGTVTFSLGNSAPIALPVNIGKQNCLIATWDGNGTIFLRVNGVEITGATNNVISAGEICLGALNDFGGGAGAYFAGSIGEMAFFRALASDDPDMMDCLEGIAAAAGATIAGR